MEVLRFLAIFLVFGLGRGEFDIVERYGPCRQLAIVKDFEPSKYLGVWYEQMRYENENQMDGDCVTATYEVMPDGKISVKNTVVFHDEERSGFEEIEGLAVLSFPEKDHLEGRLNVSFGAEPTEVNYNILHTDYTSYSIVWSCQELSEEKHQESLWILTRDIQIQNHTLEAFIDEVLGHFFEKDFVRPTIQGEPCQGTGGPYSEPQD